MLNLVHSTRNRLRPVNYFLEFLSVQIHIKGSVTSIRYCSIFTVLPARLSADSLFILPQTRELVKHFFRGFSAALFGFVGRSVERSNIILHPQGFVKGYFALFPFSFLLPPTPLFWTKKELPMQRTGSSCFGNLCQGTKAQRISMPSLYFRLPRIFLMARSTCSASSSALGSASTREKAMLFLPSPRFLPR